MKKTILTVVLSVLLGVTTQIQGQRKIATDKLQIKSLPNVGVLGTDAKGNLIESAVLLNYQKKTDNALQTTNKTVVGAINELKGSSNTPNLQQVLTKGNITSVDIEMKDDNQLLMSSFNKDKVVILKTNDDNNTTLTDLPNLGEEDLLTKITAGELNLLEAFYHKYVHKTFAYGVTITPDAIKHTTLPNDLSGYNQIITTVANGLNINFGNSFKAKYSAYKITTSAINQTFKRIVNLELPKPTVPATSSEAFNRKVVFPIPTQDTDTVVYKSNFNALKTIKFNPTTAPTTPTKGTIYFDSSDNKLKCYDGTAWQSLW